MQSSAGLTQPSKRLSTWDVLQFCPSLATAQVMRVCKQVICKLRKASLEISPWFRRGRRISRWCCFQVEYLIQHSGEHDAEAHTTVNICLNQQVDWSSEFFPPFFIFSQTTGSVSRNCTSGGWSRPFPPYHVACSVDDDIPEVKTGGRGNWINGSDWGVGSRRSKRTRSMEEWKNWGRKIEK